MVDAPPMPKGELIDPRNQAAGRHPANAVETALWNKEIKLVAKKRKGQIKKSLCHPLGAMLS